VVKWQVEQFIPRWTWPFVFVTRKYRSQPPRRTYSSVSGFSASRIRAISATNSS
jgi:hypothetical protein